MRVLIFILGAFLLLPGLCSLAFIGMELSNGLGSHVEPMFILLWLICFAISFGGVLLIMKALRPRPIAAPPDDGKPRP